VPTGLHVHARTCHGFDSVMPELPVSRHHRALVAAAARRLHEPA
jgi:hypothetical protein